MSSIKRQRTSESDHKGVENMGSLILGQKGAGGRRGESAVGGTLRLDIVSCLQPIEAEMFRTMLEAVKLSKSGTVVRVAGGWVRDKLLGLENEDIDIALDNCTGVAFAEMVNAYLKSQGQNEGKVAVIEANPEQSKHLETARMKFMGIWVDLVNLRTEVYRSESRIPEASIGTADEDALRRDFTLNALFYNVNEGKVEDKTGRGVDDLRQGIIRTPLSPMITFQDDPLRVLRAVRFAARFGFSLHEDLRAAAQDTKIQNALRTKVSPERVGVELSGMITGKMAQPALAISLLEELGLAPAVYNPPDHLVPSPPEGVIDWARGAAVARAVANVLNFRASTIEAEVQGKSECLGRDAAESLASLPAAAADQAGDESAKDVTAQGKAGTAGFEAGVAPSGGHGAGELRAAGEASPHGVGDVASGVRARTEDDEALDGRTMRGQAPATLVREIFLCAALVPLAGVKHKAKKGKLVSAPQSVVADSLKLKAKEAKNVGDILELVEVFRPLADTCVAISGAASAVEASVEGAGKDGEPALSRLSVGLAVRQAKDLWPTCVDLCCAMEMCGLEEQPQKQEQEEERRLSPPCRSPPPASATTSSGMGHQHQAAVGGAAFATHAGIGGPADSNTVNADHNGDFGEEGRARSIIEKYIGLRKAVARMGLERAWEIAPLLRGNELMEELQLPKGPEIGKQMSKQASWQLEHPEGTREQCVAFLKTSLR